MSKSAKGPKSVTGQCLCGAVKFALKPPLRAASECHCGQCRRWHGHTGVYTNVARDHLKFSESRGLAWFNSSVEARRGFCTDCGSSLFWERVNGDIVSVTVGSLDAPTGVKVGVQIFTEDKGDYYQLDDRVKIKPKA